MLVVLPTEIDVAAADAPEDNVVLPLAVAPMTRRSENVVPVVGAFDAPVSIWHQTMPWMTFERSIKAAEF